MSIGGSIRVLLLLAILGLSCGLPCRDGRAWEGRAQAEHIDQALTSRLDALVKDFHGEAGIYVRHLKSGRIVEIRADELFPTASMVKVSIMLALFDGIEHGELNYQQELTYTTSLLYDGEDILGSFKEGEKIVLSKVVMLMLTMSDNTASLWCQELAGTGTRINQWLDSNGFRQTRVNSRTPGRREDWEKYGWGQTTPREMAGLLVLIREGRAISPAASVEMYRALTRSYWNKEALSAIPPTIQAASKQGEVSRSRSEAVLVNAPSGDYVFCVITKNQADTSREHDNEGFVLLRNVSAAIWQHFEPHVPFKPAEGSEKYW